MAALDGARVAKPANEVQPAPEKISQKFDLGIWLLVSRWPAMVFALQNDLGGPPPLTAEKRDWFAGAISELFDARPDADEEIVEELLLQVMSDEFEMNIEDESEILLAKDIVQLRRTTQAGRFEGVDELQRTWEERKAKQEQIKFNVQADDEDDSEDENDDDEDAHDGDIDIQMDEAPPLVSTAPKSMPEIDADGFTKVVGKKRR